MRRCDFSGKQTIFGRNRSHSCRSTSRIFKPNLQNKTFIVNGKKIKLRICAKYIKRMSGEITKILERHLNEYSHS